MRQLTQATTRPGRSGFPAQENFGQALARLRALYIDKLDDIDRGVLRKLVEYSVKTLRKGQANRR